MSHSRNLVSIQLTVCVLLAGVAGGLIIAATVLLCCRLCLRKRKPPLTRQHVVFSRSSSGGSRRRYSWERHEDLTPASAQHSITEREKVPPERITNGKSATATDGEEPEKAMLEDGSFTITIEGAVEVTSLRRRSSGGCGAGLQRQASICLSDEEEPDDEASRMREEYRELWSLRATLEEEASSGGGSLPASASLDSSDASRTESDSEGTTAPSRLQQMKADSGYRSLESRPADSLEIPDEWHPSPVLQTSHDEVFEKPVFHRLLRHPTRTERLLIRDFSIDEKSDHLFREFSRQDLGDKPRRLRYRLHRDQDSPRLGVSPECSIEEESEEEGMSPPPRPTPIS